MAYSPTIFQFVHLLQAVYERLELTRRIVATGGSTTTIIDTTLLEDAEDDFTSWYAFVARDSAGAGAAPEGEFKLVTGYDSVSTTLTTGAFTVAVAAGDEIVLANQLSYPLYDVQQICKTAIRNLEVIPTHDITTTTASATVRHTVPTAVLGRQIIYVDILDATTSKYKIVPNWQLEAETLKIPQYAAGRTLGIWYLDNHPALTSYDTAISTYVPREYAIALCAYRVANWRREISKEILPFLIQDLNSAMTLNPVRKYQRRIQGFAHWTPSTDADTVPDPIT